MSAVLVNTQAVGSQAVRSQAMTGDPVLPSAPDLPDAERPDALQAPDWGALVKGVRDGDSAAMAELYGIFAKGIRYFLLRNLGPDDLDDKLSLIHI